MTANISIGEEFLKDHCRFKNDFWVPGYVHVLIQGLLFTDFL